MFTPQGESDMDYPKLRPVEAIPVQHQGRPVLLLRDPEGITQAVALVPYSLAPILQLFDGKHSIRDIQTELARRTGEIVFTDLIRGLAEQLDQHLLLDNDRFREHYQRLVEDFRAAPVRAAAHAGTGYPEEPAALREMLAEFFKAWRVQQQAQAARTSTESGGELVPPADTPVRGLLVPHIDLRQGGMCLAAGYENLRSSEAEVFVIFGTAHAGENVPFILTPKDFATPLGVVETDREFIALLEEHYHGDLYAEEFVHRREHSIEFQVLFLQYVLERPFQIVPVLCGTFQEYIVNRLSPADSVPVRSFLKALREGVASSNKRVCFIAGADLAHVGMRFGERQPLTPGYLRWVEAEDRRLLERAGELDPEGFFQFIAKDRNRRNICSVGGIYTLLCTLQGQAEQGYLLHYAQMVDQQIQSAVSFASVVFK